MNVIRRKNGKHYAEQSYRENGRVRKRVLAYLGEFDTVEKAFRHHAARYFASRKSRRASPFSAKDRKDWCRLAKLERVLRKHENPDYKRSEAFRAENLRWHRWEEKARKQVEQQENMEAYLLFIAESNSEFYATLGLASGASPDQIKAAYHRKARECHPDHGGSDEAMAAVNEAYDRLMSA